MEKVTAVFTGKDDSLGFKKGHNYTLCIIYQGSNISIEDSANNNNQCEYESIIAFLNNWSCVSLK